VTASRHTRKRVIIAALLILLICVGLSWATESLPTEALQRDFPQLPFESLRPSPIKGIYEVETDNGILYYAPEASCLIIGNIFSREGKNMTRQRQEERIRKLAQTLPLAQALKIGSGRHTVIEFTDPDCPYCRRAAQMLAEKENITRYIFFYPLSKTSADKVRHILCASDPEAAYKESYRGGLDSKPLLHCDTAAVQERMNIHREQGRRLGIEGTPYFIIDGHIVPGADLPAIERLLADPEPGRKK